jgi:hypothetical protein
MGSWEVPVRLVTGDDARDHRIRPGHGRVSCHQKMPQLRNPSQRLGTNPGRRQLLPALRSDEVAFLQHRFDDAAAEFHITARRARLLTWNDDLTVAEADLNRGAALMAAGRTAEAQTILRPLVELGVEGFSYQQINGGNSDRFAAISYYSSSQ